ncbi:MAG: aminoacyl-tRNA hydrolase [Treponema sp.]|jgi:PTH1 family peptidyl-tRNA hydrolase|nr:aminoacyl-tRNA hydrolase [Treponema sp.]
MIELTVFLGNPGREYAHNRHNAGRLLAERLPFAGALVWQRKYKGLYGALKADDIGAPDCTAGAHFLMPETYMNLSGDSVSAAASFFKIPPERILVVHDELELPLGTAALKFSGGLGGHNGLRSIKDRLGAADFWRLRIGIGRPGGGDISGWVLSDFAPDEAPLLERVLSACADALTRSLREGPERMLPEWNKKRFEAPF